MRHEKDSSFISLIRNVLCSRYSTMKWQKQYNFSHIDVAVAFFLTCAVRSHFFSTNEVPFKDILRFFFSVWHFFRENMLCFMFMQTVLRSNWETAKDTYQKGCWEEKEKKPLWVERREENIWFANWCSSKIQQNKVFEWKVRNFWAK